MLTILLMLYTPQEVVLYDHAHRKTHLEEELYYAKYDDFSFELFSKVSTNKRYEDNLYSDKEDSDAC